MRLRRRTGVVETPDGWAPGARRQRAAPSCNGRQPMTPTFRPGDHDAPPAATMAPAPSRPARPTRLVLACLLACPSLGQGAARPHAAPPAPRADAARISEPALGVWYPDDAQAQCGHYLQAPGPDDDVDADTIALVGALVVTPRLVHAYAEYGEGEFHLVKRVKQVA